MPDFRQQLILFKPMRPGVSGYARLQSERGALLAQVNARGLDVDCGAVTLQQVFVALCGHEQEGR